MFENWLEIHNKRIESDFEYHYPSDPRNKYIKLYYRCISSSNAITSQEGEDFLSLTNKYLSKQSLEKYKIKILSEFELAQKYRREAEESRQEWNRLERGDISYKEYLKLKIQGPRIDSEYDAISAFEHKKLTPIYVAITIITFIAMFIGYIIFFG